MPNIPYDMAQHDLDINNVSPAPVRVLELRSVEGVGGGPDKTILLGAALSNPFRTQITVCYMYDRAQPPDGVLQRTSSLGVTVVTVPEQRPFQLSTWRRLRQIVRDLGIQIVHSHDYKTDFYAWALSHVERVIPLATAHGFTGCAIRERWLYYPADRRILCRFPAVVAVSTELRDHLIRSGVAPSRLHVILNGVDHRSHVRRADQVASARTYFDLRPQHIALGTVGRLERQKRFDVLIESVARLQPRYPHLRVLVAGTGTQRANTAGTCPASRCGPRCAFVGTC